MPPSLKELKRELIWESAVFKDKLSQVQTRLAKLERESKSPISAGPAVPANGLPRTELQNLLWEQAYVTERLSILESKLKRITAVKGEG